MSDTGVILAQSRAIALPPASNQLATEVSADIRSMERYLHKAVHPVQWMAAVINELNKIEEPEKLAIGSVWETIEKLAQTGLYAGSALGHAYLVPFGKVLQLIVGYKGFIELGLSNGSIKGCACDWVLKGEPARLTRKLDGVSVADFSHDVPLGGRQPATEETVEVAYCLYETDAGFRNIVVSEKKDLLELKRKSSPKSPWRSRYGAMCLKTPIRGASKLWRQTKELAIAVQADEESERLWEIPPPEAPAQHPDAPKSQPRGERVTAANVRQLFSAWCKQFGHAETKETSAIFMTWQEPITGIPMDVGYKPEHWSPAKLAECYGRLGK